MDSNITNEQYFNGNLPLAEPHFEEEATLLSARPVVPLEEVTSARRSITTQGSSKKGLAIGVAIACSLVVGALVATLLYKQRGQTQSIQAVSTAVPGAAGIPRPELAPAIVEDVEGAATGLSSAPDAGATERKPSSPVSHSVTAKAVETKRRKPVPQQVEDTESSGSEPIDEWRLRRRSEREERRESRRHRRRRSDDLLRIREIFEGRRP
jgi:hypothetical protein